MERFHVALHPLCYCVAVQLVCSCGALLVAAQLVYGCTAGVWLHDLPAATNQTIGGLKQTNLQHHELLSACASLSSYCSLHNGNTGPVLTQCCILI